MLASFRLGSGYRKDYLRIRKGMKNTIDHNQRVLDGIHITSNYMTSENMHILVQQRKLKVIHDEYFCKFMKQLAMNLESDQPDFINQRGDYFTGKMDQTREKILRLSYQYESKR